MRLKLADNQRNKKGNLDFDPDELLLWLKEKAATAELIHMNATWEAMHDIFVIIEPPSLMRTFTNNITSWWGGQVTITVREA